MRAGGGELALLTSSKGVPRTARIELAGGIHHVTMRGNRGEVIFRNDRDRRFFLRELDDVARDCAWTWLSYCLMSNHSHLVIETDEMTLGVGMRRLAGRHAQEFNRRHEIYGHMFQERYGSVLVRSDTHFAQLLRYVALNPVAAGLCADPATWRWSSHRAMLHRRPGAIAALERVETLLEVWGGEHGTRYASLFDPSGPLATRFGAEDPSTYRPPLADLLSSTNLDQGMSSAHENGYRFSEIAAAVGLDRSTASRRVRRARECQGLRPLSCATRGSVPVRCMDRRIRCSTNAGE